MHYFKQLSTLPPRILTAILPTVHQTPSGLLLTIFRDSSAKVTRPNARYIRHAYSTTAPIPPTATSTTTHLPRDDDFHCVALAAYRDFHAREQTYLLHTYDANATISSPEDKPSYFPAVNLSIQSEVMFTLGGAKPCVLTFVDLQDVDTSTMYDDFARNVLIPWFEEHGLEKYGFIIRKIEHSVRLIIGSREDYCALYVLADTRSALWPRMHKMFFTDDGT